MKINVEFNTVEEMQEFAKLIGAPCKCSDKTVTVTQNEEKEDKKDNSKSDKKNTSKKQEKAKAEDKPKEEPKEQAKEEAPKVETEKVGEPEPPVTPTQDSEPIEEVKKVTKEEIRAAFTKAIKLGKQAESKAITQKYGASKLSELKEEDYPAVLKDVEALL